MKINISGRVSNEIKEFFVPPCHVDLRESVGLSVIPDWTMAGVIPPIRPGLPGYHPDRSPYHAGLDEFVGKFALTPQRASVLQGFLNYRAALHRLGILSGFQWLDGSFLENVEDTEGRAPRDLDVVTFFYLPAGETQASLFARLRPLLERNTSKATYSVDGFALVLGSAMTEATIRQTCYWYSMWSHRRDGLWKGFVQVDLSPAADHICVALLQQKVFGGTP